MMVMARFPNYHDGDGALFKPSWWWWCPARTIMMVMVSFLAILMLMVMGTVNRWWWLWLHNHHHDGDGDLPELSWWWWCAFQTIMMAMVRFSNYHDGDGALFKLSWWWWCQNLDDTDPYRTGMVYGPGSVVSLVVDGYRYRYSTGLRFCSGS